MSFASAREDALLPRSARWSGDGVFRWVTMLMALCLFVLAALSIWLLVRGSWPAWARFGWHFLTSSEWDPLHSQFGAAPFVWGTLLSSAIALVLAVPLSIATALYLTEWAPKWLSQPLSMLVEILASVPSVILGLWGLSVLVPWLRDHPIPGLDAGFGLLPNFGGLIYVPSLLAVGIMIALMIIPTITSLAQQAMRAVPSSQREAAWSLGATRWEVSHVAVLKVAKTGILAAVVLAFGRALGEATAVTMVLGHRMGIGASFPAPGETMASVIVRGLSEARTELYIGSLCAIGTVLFGVTLLVNVTARALLRGGAASS